MLEWSYNPSDECHWAKVKDSYPEQYVAYIEDTNSTYVGFVFDSQNEHDWMKVCSSDDFEMVKLGITTWFNNFHV